MSIRNVMRLRRPREDDAKDTVLDSNHRTTHPASLASETSSLSVLNRRFILLLLPTAFAMATLRYFQLEKKQQSQMDWSMFECRQVGDEVEAEAEEKSSPCVYFRPIRFFFDSIQPGYPYKHLLEGYDGLTRWTMWGKQVSTFHKEPDHASFGRISPPAAWLQDEGIESVSTILLPKVASRSIETLFLERLSIPVGQRQQRRHRARMGATAALSSSSSPRVGIATSSFWKQLAGRQQLHSRQAVANDYSFEQSASRTVDLVFSLVRDPLSRFLSALAQTLSSPMMVRQRTCAEFWRHCLDSVNDDYRELVKCAIRSMKREPLPLEKGGGHELPLSANNGNYKYYYFDVHMLPQAVILANVLDKKHDVEVRMFDMKELNHVLHAFDPGHSSSWFASHYITKRSSLNRREEKHYSTDIATRFADNLLYPQRAREAILADGAILHDICQLYAVDVAMMHHLGFSAGDCDTFALS